MASEKLLYPEDCTIMLWGELLYMIGCEGAAGGNDDAKDESATCIVLSDKRGVERQILRGLVVKLQ